jgi:hypothetical protein
MRNDISEPLDRACAGRVLPELRRVFSALPALWHCRERTPAAAKTIRATGVFIREHPFELGNCELVEWLGLFTCHDGPSN